MTQPSDNYAIRVHQQGGPEQLVAEAVPVPDPGPGQVLVRNTAIGLNFLDTYHRGGLYPMPVPLIPGVEGAGVVEALGPGVTDFEIGDRVAYVGPVGAYCLRLLRPAERLVKVPDDIADDAAAASLLKGITAHYLVHSTYQVAAGETILVHAAAGGVGQILCQWAAAMGATVIGTVGSAAKVDIARRVGCHHVVDTSQQQASTVVRELTAGRGVPVVYDGIGKATFMDSLDCLQPRGLMVSYGNASGAVEAFNLGLLAAKGSLYVTRPGMDAYTATPGELRERSAAVFRALAEGEVAIAINARYPLREAAQAHRDLEARKTTGSSVFIP